MFRFSPLCIALLLSTSVTAYAQTAIDQSHPLAADGRLDINNVKGSIQVTAWDRNEVKISGTLGQGVEKLSVEGSPEHLEIRVVYPRGSGWGGSHGGPTDLKLMVPLRAELDVESVSADVDVTGVAPRQISIESVSGAITAIGAPQRADLQSVSGDISATLNSRDVDLQTVSGRLDLRGRLSGDVSAETVSGDINVAVNGEQVTDLSTNTVSGDAEVHTDLASKGEIHMESVSGNLLLVVPRTLSARVSGESFSGDLKAPGVTIKKERGPGSSFSTRYGAADGEVTLETFSGDAELRLQ
ncbi:DUF4097 family beta strand repeat-containing protein [Pseudoxanthomonas dokdonensis]|uniref:DUF4097 domain-containing protein n=1 Tax=Pseudoxanthomonas dokdonensis TaxID=344882 RepID=A0A0R0CKS4_9GAMM|nr:DUF4097 family beta strand repeat-containing protein [Pseudoxanthomonas dokdonensis]KRG70139.1 hypothetical protein ABB29_07940 [Pseudoxanthomonas dokdonensis]